MDGKEVVRGRGRGMRGRRRAGDVPLPGLGPKGPDLPPPVPGYPAEEPVMADQQQTLSKEMEGMSLKAERSAVKPSLRLEARKREMDGSGIMKNEFLESSGIGLDPNPVKIVGRILPKPKMEAGKGRKIVVKKDGNWDWFPGQEWFEPGACGPWQVVCLDPNLRENTRRLQNFVQRYADVARGTGMRLGGERFEDWWVPGPKGAGPKGAALETLFKQMGSRGVQFSLFVLENNTGENNKAIKDMIKLLEWKYEITTQCVITKTVVKIGGGGNQWPQGMLMNILAKSNMKNDGLNYRIFVDDDQELAPWFQGEGLFLGADVQHPVPQSKEERRLKIPPKEPSVTGMVGSGPGKSGQFRYTGETWYQDPTVEEITAMKRLVLVFLRRYVEKSGGVLPKWIFMFRDGVSEGQYKMLLAREFPAIKAACEEFRRGWCPPVNLVAVKRHSLRMILPSNQLNPAEKASRQDYAVGTAVDHTVVDGGFWEYYIKSHKALNGKAKATRYVVVRNEMGLSQNEMEGLTFTLAYGHQICQGATSIPAPVYGADEMAERGKKIFRAEMALNEGSSSGYSGGAEGMDWEDFSLRHMITGTKFEHFKHWA